MLLTAILSNMLTGTVLTLGFYVSFVMVLHPSLRQIFIADVTFLTSPRAPAFITFLADISLHRHVQLCAPPRSRCACSVSAPVLAPQFGFSRRQFARRYELLPREPDTPPPDVEVVVDGEEKVEELHHRRQSSV
jgi:hypothetical protein